jgi:general secretion pathway protein L
MGRGPVTTLLFLPGPDAPYRWLRVDERRVLAEGEGLPPPDDEPVVAVPPADAVTLHWAALPDRSLAQATAAARILAAEASATPATELHVAVGPGDAGERPIAVVAADAMRRWLASLASAGIDPDAVAPAPLLLPAPEQGFVRAELAGGGVVRGATSGFADEARLTDLVTGGEAPRTLGRAAVDAALVAAAAAPPLDLRQGPFARRRRVGIDWALIRRLALLGAVILLVTLGISLIRIAKYSFAADALELQAAQLAATGLPRGETITDADRQLAERLGAVRGPGLGFTAMAASVFAAVRQVPGTEVTGLEFTSTGDLRLTISAARESLPTDLKRAIERAGFNVGAGVFTAANGRVTGDMTVRVP